MLRRLSLLVVVSFLAASAFAAAFTPGNLVVVRVASGSSNAAAVFLDEYTTAGALVQSIPLPTTDSGAQQTLTLSGSATSEGALLRSVDGRYLTLIGYDAAPGTVSVASSTSAAANRVIARIDANGNVDTSTALTDAFSGTNPRAAVSNSGSEFWITGGNGVRYAGSVGATTSASLASTNLRVIGIFGDQLYASSASGAFRLATVGTGVPTSGTQTITNVVTGPTSPYGFFFADLSAAVAGVDTVYIADDGGQLRKFSLVSGTWTANNTVTLSSVRTLTGRVSGTSVALYVSNGSTVQTLTDSTGYNANMTASFSTLTTPVVPGTGNAFRGIAFVPTATTPVVQSVTAVTTSPTNLSTVSYTVTFNQDVTGVDAADFTVTMTGVTGASVTNVSGGNAVYTVDVSTGTGDGTIRLDVTDNDSIKNSAFVSLGGEGTGTFGGGSFITGASITIDKTAPSVSSSLRTGAALTNASSVGFVVSFNENVTGVDMTDFVLTTTGTISGTSISNVTGTGPYTVTVNTGTGDGDLRLDVVDNDSISDSAGNTTAVAFVSGDSYTIDRTAPSVQSIVRVGGPTTSAPSVDFTVTFSEDVSNVGTGNFALDTTGVSGAAITTVTPVSDSVYTVSVNTGSGDGTIRLDLTSTGTIVDDAGNALAGTFLTGETFTVDKSVPSVVSIALADTDPTNATDVDFTVTFSTAVSGVDSSDFDLILSGVTASINTVASGDGGTTWNVNVNSVAGTGTLGLDLDDNDSILATSNSAPLGGPGADNGDFTGDVYTVDQTAPAVDSIALVGPPITNAASVDFTVTFTESVTGVGTADFTLTTTGTVSGATVDSVTGTGPYTVTVLTGTGDGTIRLDVVDDGTIDDLAGNGLSAGYTGGPSVTIDKTAPTVSSANRVDPNPTTAASVNFAVTFSEPVLGVDATDFALVQSGVTGATITGVAPAGPPPPAKGPKLHVGPPPPAFPVWTVTVNTGNGSGTLGLNVLDDNTIIDPATNALGGTFTGQVYQVDKAPLAPASLTATADDGVVHLSWPAANGAATYNVKRGVAPGGPYPTVVNNIAALNYDDSSVVNGTTYYYIVTATNPLGEGPASPEANATPAVTLAAPANLTAKVGDARVTVSWQPVPGAATYNVKRGINPGGPYTTIASPATTSHLDTTVANGTTYFYVVTAVGPESAPSNEVAATPNTPAALGVVISQAYGGGGNTGATFKNDFIELFNRGNQVVDLTGWSVQYASTAGTFSVANSTALTGAIPPGRYYLVQEIAGAGGTTNLPTPDASGGIAMAAGGFKVAVASVTTALPNCTATTIADLLGAGAANCSETAVAPAPSNTTADLRANNGCTDTNNNASDFATGTPNPRNSASPQASCGFQAVGSANPAAVDPGQNTILSVQVTPAAAPPSTGITVTADLTSIGGAPNQPFYDNGTNGDDIALDNNFKFDATVSLATTGGAKSILAVVTDAQARGTSANIALTVNPPLETIALVKIDGDANTVPDRIGQTVRVRGVVTSIDFRGGNGVEYYIEDPTGGIDVFHSTSNFGPFTLGDNVDVTGTLTQFNGLTELVPTVITPLPGGTLPPVTPQTVTIAGINESIEGRLIRVDNLTIPAGTFAADTNYVINDGTAGSLRIDGDTAGIVGNPTPPGIFSVVGVISQFDSSAPHDSGYQILPRSGADIIPRTAPTGTGAANPPSVPPGGTTLLTVTVTPGQNPGSTGIDVVVDLSSIGGSATQAFLDDGSTNGDVTPGDGVYSFSATVDNGTALGAKSLPVSISDDEARGSNTTIPLNIQSASAPAPPANLVATPGNGQVGLTWDASAGATDYNVKRSTTNGGPYTTLTNTASTSYTDTAVTNGTPYYYVVTALSGANESGNSAQVTATPSAPPPSGPLAKIYFVDIGQGAGTLIVGPTGKSLLVDAGPTGQGNAKVIPLLNTLGISTIDYTLVTHYHVDHDAGMTEVINAGRVSGIAYDNGDAPHVVPPVPSNSTGTAFTAYKNAIAAHSGTVTRTTITPGLVIDLGGGMKATCLVAGGDLASGGNIYVSGTDLNSSSISLLIEYNNFDYLVSGDLTGGGQTTTAKTPDVETFVAQMAGDVDVVQLDHHGSTTANNRRFLGMLKAEMAFASVGASNTFGHPNRETVNKYLNIPVTSGNTYGGETLPNPGNGPVFYQTDPSPATDNRCSVQGYSGTSHAAPGEGTLLLETDGLISFTVESFDDGGVRIPASAHVYALDATGASVTTNFPPTVVPFVDPGVPTASQPATITALVSDREDPITSVTLGYALNGAAQAPVVMTNSSGSEYTAVIPAQPNGTRVDYTITAVANGTPTTYPGGYFSGTTNINVLRAQTPLGEPQYLDYGARISGLVTSGTGNFSSSNNDDYIVDGTGALNISRTIEPSTPPTQPTSTGNTYTVAGYINQLTGRFRLDVTPPFDGVDEPWTATPGSYNPYSITPTGSGTVTPLARTIAQINANPEGIEAQLVTITGCTVVSGTIPASGGIDGFLVINDGTGTMEMKIDGDGSIPGLATPAGTFNVTGIIQQDDFLRPFDTRYTIAPRNRTDLGAAGAGPSLITIAEAREDIDPGTGLSPHDFVPDRLGQQVKVRGVVTSVDFRGASGTEVYIQDPTGGVDIFSTSINIALSLGDSVEVTGTVAQFNGLTEITPSSISDIVILPTGTMPPAVLEVVTVSQLGNAGVGEPYEGRLVRINNVTITSPPATFAANTNYNITDGSGTVQMRIDSDTDIDGTAPPAGTFSVIGVLGQFDNASPFDSGYQLFPRIRATDFLPAVPPAAAITATAGTPQSAAINTAFATDLQATVTDSGSAPIAGIGVTFTAPASGASGTFTNGQTTVSVATNGSGVATATIFTANAIAGSYNVVASTSSFTANFALTNVDDSATHFSVSAPATVTAGVPFNVTVTALNVANSTATSYLGTVHFTSSSAGTLPLDYTFVEGDNGQHVFSVTLTDTGTQSITATDVQNSEITGSTSTDVQAAAPVATHFSVSAPATVTNGVAFNVTVTALDASEAIVTGYTGTVHFTSSSAGTLPPDYTFLAGDNGAHTFSVTLTTNGSQSITATDTSNSDITGTTSTDVQAAAPVATHFSVTAPANVTNGVAFNVTVTALDASEATVTGYTGTVHFTSSSAGTLPPDYTFLAGDNGAHTFSVTLTTNGNQSITATDTVTASITGSTSTDVQAAAPVATHFSVSAPANVTNGVAFNVTVTALDASEATVTGYTGTVHFTSTSAGTLPPDYTFLAGDNGAHTFSVTLTSNGSQSVTAIDTSNADIDGSANVTVLNCDLPTTPTVNGTTNGTGSNNKACPAQPLTLTATSTGAVSYQWYRDLDLLGGETSSTLQVTSAGTYYVTATNSCGTTAKSAGYVVSNPTPGAATITANNTTICAGGTVVLSSNSASGIQWYRDNVAIPGANSQNYSATIAGTYHVTLNSLGCPSAASNQIVLTASANAAPNADITAPATVPAGSTGNIASVADAGAGATYDWTIGGPGTITSGAGTRSITFSPFASFGTMTIHVTVTLPGGCTDTKSKDVTVVSGAGVTTHLSVTSPGTVTTGVPFNVTVTALDSTNAVATGYTGTVHFTSTSAGTLPGDYTFLAGDNGTHTFSVTLTTLGAQSVTATDTSTASITGTANLTVTCDGTVPAAAVITAPAEVCANSTGNTASAATAGATSYAWSITNGTITAGQGTATITFTAGSSGSVGLTVLPSDGGACPIATTGSESVPIRALPTATLPSSVEACAGSPFNITATLTGTAPFTIHWSDGATTSSNTFSHTRTFSSAPGPTVSITSVDDASCTSSGPSNATTINLDTTPLITLQPQHKVIPANTSTTLTVGSPNTLSYQWYQGHPGDTSTPVGTNSPSFTTSNLTGTTFYWVRLSNSCGTTDSQMAVVSVTGKRRAASH